MLPDHLFRFCPAQRLVMQLDRPFTSGTYLVLIRAGDRLLELAGYFRYHDRVPYQCGGFYHLYTGCGGRGAARVKHHLLGTFGSSNLRWTLHALELTGGMISRSGIGPWDHPDLQQRITFWLIQNVLIGICECRDAFLLEKAILAAEPSPLNLDQRRWDPFAQQIISARARTSAGLSRKDIYRANTH